jgi:hypothetical protein
MLFFRGDSWFVLGKTFGRTSSEAEGEGCASRNEDYITHKRARGGAADILQQASAHWEKL